MSSRSEKSSLRTFSARAVALLAVAMAAAWGPLQHSLRVAVSVGTDAHSCRLVLAGSVDHSKAVSSAKKSGAQKTETKTERLFSAVPDSLESTASIHFELSVLPAEVAVVDFTSSQTAVPSLSISAPRGPPLERPHLPRGPPLS